MKNVLKFISMLAIVTITLLATSCENFGRPVPPPVVEEPVYEEEEITPEQAAENMLTYREQTVWDHACDSVFLVMPEKVIIYITLHNPDYGSWDIANEYLLKKELYDKLDEDIKLVNKFKEQQAKKSSTPDTIPTKTKPDKQTMNSEEM